MSQPGNVRPMVRLWRVEHEDSGWGPFVVEDCLTSGDRTDGVCPVWDCDHTFTDLRHPSDMPPVWYDRHCRGPTGDMWREHFGTGTRFAYWGPANILRWAGGEALKRAMRYRYVVRVYSVPWDAHSRYKEQAVFDVRRSKVLRTVGLASLYWQ